MQVLERSRTNTAFIETAPTRSDPELLKRFCIRGRGVSLQFNKPQLLQELSIAEQIFAALLCEDPDQVRALVLSHPWRHWYPEFSALVDEAKFAGIICDLIATLELETVIVEAATLPEEGQIERANRWVSICLKRMFRRARQELCDSMRANGHFVRILATLGEHSCEPIWLKGLALSHAVYPRVEFRAYGDYDCFVKRSFFKSFVQTMKSNLPYDPINQNAGFCMQHGVGPTAKLDDLLLSPASGLVCTDVTSLTSASMLPIDLKLNPLIRGLIMVQLDRFDAEAEIHTWRGKKFRAPSVVDSLMIALVNLVDGNRFSGWRSLYDVHILVMRMNRDSSSWTHFLECCKAESIRTHAWAGLTMAVDRFRSPVPDAVLNDLRPGNFVIQSLLAFTINSEFVWNANCIPMLLLSAIVHEDFKRKLSVITRAFFPSRKFLHDYYAGTKLDHYCLFPFRLLVHWLILLLPGGAVRRIFGHRLWKRTQMKS